MEIDYAIFQEVESLGKGRFFKMTMEKVWIVVWEVVQSHKMDFCCCCCCLLCFEQAVIPSFFS